MSLGWPELIYVALGVLGLGYAIAKHGEPREPWSAKTAFLGLVLSWGLLWWGGFFS